MIRKKRYCFPTKQSELKKPKLKWAVHVGRYEKDEQYKQILYYPSS
jgi:hypothetical protein